MIRYLIISEKNGIFLGRIGVVGIFSLHDTTGISVAYTFETEEIAKTYTSHFQEKTKNDFIIQPVEVSEGEHITYIELVKQGFGKYLENMLFYAESPSKLFH